jgi:hypothetical protein
MGGSPEPTPVTPAAASSGSHPSGSSAIPSWVQAWREGDVVGPPDKPEVAVGAAFAGGLLVALILKRLGR